MRSEMWLYNLRGALVSLSHLSEKKNRFKYERELNRRVLNWGLYTQGGNNKPSPTFITPIDMP